MSVAETGEQAAVLRRLEEVATREYPFPKPAREKAPDSFQIRSTSLRTLSPVAVCFAKLAFMLFRPVILLLCIALAAFGYCMWLSITVGVGIIGHMLHDRFLQHRFTDGVLGGLGGKGTHAGVHCKETPRNKLLADTLRRFVSYKPTLFLFSGDWLTIGPYLLFKGSSGGRVRYQRWWIRVNQAPAPDGRDGPARRPTGGEDDEAVALDISFPKGGHRQDKPVFLFLHGLNGGSTEPYVLDAVRRANREGSTACVLINRGLMKTFVKSKHLFTGARTSDVGAAVDTLLHACGCEKRGEDSSDSARLPLKTRIVLVGYSMGAIIAANYVSKARGASGLAGAVAFSGMLCPQKNLEPEQYAHSSTVWQPLLAFALKHLLIVPDAAKIARCEAIKLDAVESAVSVTDLDTAVICPLNGYADVREYYADMGAAGRGDAEGLAKLSGAAVPLLAVHAVDDPMTVYECCLSDLSVAATENVLVLATEHGGHIGWPQGLWPQAHRWDFMCDVFMTFGASVFEGQ
eukprot:TRINITY_DN62737_c0_g1_i1.p1 TRINITY_DN62737_c0_g1~~TRINITY_DN62737_c0_g1_i1.p1  ORF type:complete len:517 (-),score=59.43 TRINITY_DN62737_c0_g1_i1:61-1611(-)